MKSTVCRAYTRVCAFAAFSRHPDAGTVISFARRTHTPTYCSQTSESATERWSALGVKVNTHRRSPSPDQGTLSSQISTSYPRRAASRPLATSYGFTNAQRYGATRCTHATACYQEKILMNGLSYWSRSYGTRSINQGLATAAGGMQ